MSDTHGIYVAGFHDGYRVAYCGCIENVFEFGILSPEGKNMTRQLFSDSSIYSSRSSALEAAHDIAAEYSSLGYGVTDLGNLGQFCLDALIDSKSPTMTAEEVLRRLMKNFCVTYGGGLEWAYITGLSVQQVEGQAFFKELSKYLDDRALEDLKRFRQT